VIGGYNNNDARRIHMTPYSINYLRENGTFWNVSKNKEENKQRKNSTMLQPNLQSIEAAGYAAAVRQNMHLRR
jgi:hypothetical protein